MELGFGEVVDGKVIIPDDQRRRILNLDETCLALDGNKGKQGGRPSATFYDPNLPWIVKADVKSSLTTTMITRSIASGEEFPPHFQFSKKDKSDEQKRLQLQLVEWMLNIHRQVKSMRTIA